MLLFLSKRKLQGGHTDGGQTCAGGRRISQNEAPNSGTRLQDSHRPSDWTSLSSIGSGGSYPPFLLPSFPLLNFAECAQFYQPLYFGTLYREVQLDFTPEIEIFYMMYERCLGQNRKISIRQHT